MRRYFFCLWLITLCVWVAGCAGPYQTARRYFDRSHKYYEKGHKSKTLREYNRIIRILEEQPSNQSIAFFQAALYHRFYLIDLPSFWSGLDKYHQAKWPRIGKLIEKYPQSDKFLDSAFMQIMELEENLKGDYPDTIEPGLLIEKNLIVGDYIVYKGNQGDSLFQPRKEAPSDASLQSAVNTEPHIRTSTAEVIPASFVDKIRRYAFCEVAKNFYLQAWIKAIMLTYENPSANLEPVMKLSRRRLKDIYWSLATLTSSLEYSNRSDEFTRLFKNRARNSLEAMRRLEQVLTLPLSTGGPLSAEKIQESLGVNLERDYLSLDGEFHIKESRVKVSMAVEEILAQKTSLAYQYLLDALKHIALLRTLNWQGFGGDYLIDNISEDIYLNLYRLSE